MKKINVCMEVPDNVDIFNVFVTFQNEVGKLTTTRKRVVDVRSKHVRTEA
jgi:hypothetical protein